MPRKLIKKIEQEYEAKGKTPKEAKRIAYATANKKGLLADKSPVKRKIQKRKTKGKV